MRWWLYPLACAEMDIPKAESFLSLFVLNFFYRGSGHF